MSFSFGEECTLSQLQECLESLQSKAQDLALAATYEDLMINCHSLKASVFCVDVYVQSCFSPTQKKVLNDSMSETKKFLEEMCEPGKIREDYLKYSPCYRNLSLQEEKCGPKYRAFILLSDHVDENLDADEGLKKYCCAFQEFVLCRRAHAERDCGPEASYFLRQHLESISNPLIHEHCEHYMHAQDACLTSGSSSLLDHSLLASSYILVNKILNHFVHV